MDNLSTELWDLAPCGLIECDENGKIINFNSRIIRWAGLENCSNFPGASVEKIFTKAGQIFFQTHVLPLLRLQEYVSEVSLNLRLADGGTMPVFFSAEMDSSFESDEPRIVCALFKAAERHQYEQELNFQMTQARQLASLLAVSPDAIISLDPGTCIQSWNASAEQLFGYKMPEVAGKQFEFLLSSSNQKTNIDMELLLSDWCGKLQERVCTGKDGQQFPVEINMSATEDSAGKTTGVIAIIRDISGRLENEKQLKVLMREVNHRSKNLLAVVQAVARQTQRNTPPDQFMESFSERIDSLALNQELLVENNWKGIELRKLIETQVSHLSSTQRDQFQLDGPTIELGSNAAQSLGMAFFELSTNAIKYGALSNGEGLVTISWRNSSASEELVEIEWQEQGGPEVTTPTTRGFGGQVTGAILESNLDGKIEALYPPQGLIWKFSANRNTLAE